MVWFEHTVATPFFQLRGHFLATHNINGLFLNPETHFFDRKGLFWTFDHQYFNLFWYWPIKLSINMINFIHLSALQMASSPI